MKKNSNWKFITSLAVGLLAIFLSVYNILGGGVPGPQGETGPQGLVGPKGEDGVDGQDGKDGEDGQDGQDGKDGEDGQDGQDGVTPHIGDNGNWWVGDIDTNIPATGPKGEDGQDGKDGEDGQDGKDGLTPYIGSNGNWWVGETDLQVKAQGDKGDKGDDGKTLLEISIERLNKMLVKTTSKETPLDRFVEAGITDYNFVNLKPYNCEFYYSLKDKQFIAVDLTNFVILGSASYQVDSLLPNATTDLYKFIFDGELSTNYSNFLTSDFVPSSAKINDMYPIVLNTSFDCGWNENTFEITYDRSMETISQEVLINTNGGNIIVNAPLDVVKHYGTTNNVKVISVDSLCYHENGNTNLIDVYNGKIVVEKSSSIKNIHISKTDDAFDNITVKIANGSNEPTLSRDSVGINLTTNVLLLKLETSTINEYIWMTGNGTIEDSYYLKSSTIDGGKTPLDNSASVIEKSLANKKVNDAILDIGGQIATNDFSGGSGVENDPYLINNVEQLKKIDSKQQGANKFYKLVNNLTCDSSDLLNKANLDDPRVIKPAVPCYCLVPYLNGSNFDGNNHCINFTSSFDVTEDRPKYPSIFAELINGSIVKDLTITTSGYLASICHWTNVVTLSNVDLEGSISWCYKNMGAYIHYPHCDATLIDCDNKADIQNNAALGSSYCSTFLGVDTMSDTKYYLGEDRATFTFTNCTYSGTASSGQIGMFLANSTYRTNDDGIPAISIILNNCKNNGTIKILGGLYNGDGAVNYNYITADTWDKAYSTRVSYDNGVTFQTTTTEKRWCDIANQQNLIGTGSFVDLTNNDLTFTLNSNNTFTVNTTGIENVSYVKFHVAINSSKVMDVVEKVTGTGELTSTIKNYQFVNENWVLDNPGGIESNILGFKTYTLDSVTYYVASNEVVIHGVESGVVSVVVYNSSNNIICAKTL